VALGYKNKPEVTAKQFVDDPFAPGRRLYASGDLGRLDERGQLVFLGRRDFQIKLRGYRIELAEIESALLSHPDIKECVITSTRSAALKPEQELIHCVKCGLASSFPNTTYT